MSAALRLAYDMRAPDFGTPATELYPAAVEQCAWADTRGFESVILSEHHASEDGFLPSPIVLGSAIASVTKTMTIELSALLLPLYNPIRLAEDLAVLNLVSRGRMRVVVGLGYRPVEYQQLGVEMKHRPRLMADGVAMLKAAWTGEPFGIGGTSEPVLPRPAQRPRPKIVMAGASPASARRAAVIADAYQPLSPKLYGIYLKELDRLGRTRPPSPRRGDFGASFVHISTDPEAAWARIAPHALHETNSYGSWAAGLRGAVYEQVSDADELRRRGSYQVLTPDQAIDFARTHGELTLKPLMGGMAPELGWECLELAATEVAPALRAG